MSTAAQITTSALSTEDKEQQWKEHAKNQKESELSRVAYCRKHQLNYEQFGYWLRKWRQHPTSHQPAVLLPPYYFPFT